MSASRAPRVSLTKLQRESAAGVELIALCREIAEDGRLSDAEIADLRDWVRAFSDVPMAARGHLDLTLQHVLADGVITDAERLEVSAAIEKVLPPDVRTEVAARRHRRQDLDELANGPLAGWDFMVAGCRYDGRPEIIEAECHENERVFLVREPTNPHDENAIAVRLKSGAEVGYVPRADAVEMAALLDSDNPYHAFIKKILAGGRSPIPVVVADFYPHATNIAGLSRSQSAPERRGCATAAATVVIGFTVAVAQSLLG